MKRLVKFLWQLPQNIIGLLLVVVVRADTIKKVDGKRIWYSERMRGADEVEELKIPMVWLSIVLHLVVVFTILLLV